MQKIVVVFLLSLLTACAGQQHDTNMLAQQLNVHSPEKILNSLQKETPPERDIAQFHLNIGYLQLLTGDFDASIDNLTLAKKEMALLDAISITENIGAGTVNETLRSYSGYATDKVMVHNILALSYLFNNNIDAARVEVLQADVAMKQLANKDSLVGQLSSAHLIAGVIYEMLDEPSNALISYKHVESILKQRKIMIPVALKQALLRMSYTVDSEGQYVTYNKEYSGFSTPLVNNNSQVFMLYFDGVVSNKRQNSITIPSGNREQLIHIAMPGYPQDRYRKTQASLTDNQHKSESELIENLEVLVREDLSREYPSILLLTTTRALAKYELVSQANDADPLLGIFANLVTLISEVADLRSWNMLPSNIQFAYIDTSDDELMLGTNRAQQRIAIKKSAKNGTSNLLLVSSLKTQVFQYIH